MSQLLVNRKFHIRISYSDASRPAGYVDIVGVIIKVY
jgi:hypothetical protein